MLAQVLDEIVVAGIVGEVVVARSRSVLFSQHPGLDVDLFSLDQNLLHLAGGDPVEEVGERDLATGGRIAPEDLEDEHHPHNDHSPHEHSSYSLIHGPISSSHSPLRMGAMENLTLLPNLPPVRSRTGREDWCAGCGSGRDRSRSRNPPARR